MVTAARLYSYGCEIKEKEGHIYNIRAAFLV